MFQAERQEQILVILRKDLTIRGSRLSQLLGVFKMTIRRDLDILENQGVWERPHGGAVFRQERLIEKFHYGSSIQKMIEQSDTTNPQSEIRNLKSKI